MNGEEKKCNNQFSGGKQFQLVLQIQKNGDSARWRGALVSAHRPFVRTRARFTTCPRAWLYARSHASLHRRWLCVCSGARIATVCPSRPTRTHLHASSHCRRSGPCTNQPILVFGCPKHQLVFLKKINPIS